MVILLGCFVKTEQIAGVAQSVEQLIRNQQVGGSSPPTSSTKTGVKKHPFFYVKN